MKDKKMKLFENEHPLVTPNFIGTDQEKINVLGYWAGLISMLRSMNISIVSHENKLAVIKQLRAELDIIDVEINNVSSHEVTNQDGSPEMSTMPKEPIVNLAEPEVKESLDPYARFNIKASPVEAMKRLAGNYYKK